MGNPAATGTRSRTQMQLRQDLLPLLAVISLNTTLTSLDVSGHQMGNKGATALGKALQINNTLLHLAWDENATTLPGFSYFKYVSYVKTFLSHQAFLPFINFRNRIVKFT